MCRMDSIHIALSAEKIYDFFGLPITNTLITSWGVIILLIFIGYFIGKNLNLRPSKRQTLFEILIEGVLKYMEDVLEDRKLALKFLPLILTIFLFVFLANTLEFLPGIGSIGFYHGEEFLPLFRSVNTDLNMTLALAIISFFSIELAGIFTIGFLKYFSKFVNFRSVMGFFVGIIELFSEIARLISFSFRLFGNIFAGEVLILVITYFVPYFLPVPFVAFEVFVGFVQAAIFAVLTLFFVKIAVEKPH